MRITHFFTLLILASTSAASEPELVSGPRLLTLADVGKVFLLINDDPHPNFGRYKVLTSVDALYGFDTFDLENGKAAGKLHISHFASPNYREVRIDRETMSRVWTAIRLANEENERQMAAWRATLPGGDRTLLPEKPRTAPLELGEIASYSNLISRPNPEKLAVNVIPALVAALLLAEPKAGRALTRQEVESIRDKKLAMTVMPEALQQQHKERGYDDIDPAKAWEQWQVVRAKLLK